MRLGREVNDDVVAGNEPVDESDVLNPAFHQRDAIAGGGQTGAAARIGQGVEHGDAAFRMIAERGVDEIGTDEAGAAGDEKIHGWEQKDERNECYRRFQAEVRSKGAAEGAAKGVTS